MLDALVAVLGAMLLLLGLAVATIGLYGMLRRPDIFEQLHAAGLVTGPGVILVLLASLATGHAEIVTSALLVVAFVLVTSSLSTHAIALAAWRRREAMPVPFPEGMATAALDRRPTGAAVPVPMRVLVAFDGSPDADVAVRLVAGMPWPPGSVIRPVAVEEGELPPLSATERGRGRPDRQSDELVRALEHAADSMRRTDLRVDPVVRGGHAASAIVDEAAAFDAQLVVVGSRGLGRVRSLLAGSVAGEVVDRAPCPVLVARSARLRSVLLATDGSEPSEAAIRIVARWPIFESTPINVLSVATVARPDPDDADIADAEDLAEIERHRQIVDGAVTQLRERGRAAIATLETGDAAGRIAAVAETELADLVIIGSRGRTGLRRALLGSVARTVLSSARTSVLVVRMTDRRGA